VCVLCGGKKERTKRFRCVPLVPSVQEIRKRMRTHTLSPFLTNEKKLNRSSKKSFNKKKSNCQTAEKRIAFFLSNTQQLSSFLRPFFSSHSLALSKVCLSVELYHPRKYDSHHERQLFDVYEDDTNDDVLLLHILFFVFFFFFFETVEANWTGRREKKERFEIFNITIVGGKSG